MLNISNLISLSRAGLALFFLSSNPQIRLIGVLLAMFSDFLDGYIARRYNMASHFGALLDPLMDKFFVFFAGGVFYLEHQLTAWKLLALLSRDVSLCLFGLYLGCVRGWKGYECRAIWWGKITTVCQFALLLALTLKIPVPSYLYFLFVVMAIFAFIELLVRYRNTPHKR